MTQKEKKSGHENTKKKWEKRKKRKTGIVL